MSIKTNATPARCSNSIKTKSSSESVYISCPPGNDSASCSQHEDEVSGFDLNITVTPLRKCKALESATPGIRFKSITEVGYVSIVGEKDILVDRLFLLENVAGVLATYLQENILFDDRIQTGRQLSIFGPPDCGLNTKNASLYNTNSLDELPNLINGINASLASHFNDHPVPVNACLIEKITSGTKAHSSPLLPDKLAQNIPNISLVGVLSLGCECILDVFPRNQGTSITNEVLAGRAMLTDGSLTLMSGEASMSLKLYTSHELRQDKCNYRIILLALPTPNIDEDIVHHNLSNLIGYRMAQVNVYHTVIKEKLGTKSLNKILSLFGESTTDFDTKEDKIIRIITLLQTLNHPQPTKSSNWSYRKC